MAASPLRRVVLVAEAFHTVEAIRVAVRKSGEFKLVGYANMQRISASTIAGARPDVVLLDDIHQCDRALALIRELKVKHDTIPVIVLSDGMSPGRLERVFNAGASGAISRTTHPAALVTLLRETLSGNILHNFASMCASREGGVDVASGVAGVLTSRELEILRLVAAGATNVEVASKLWVTEQTVKFHLRNIYRKLDVANRTEASHFAHVNGLVSTESLLAVAS